MSLTLPYMCCLIYTSGTRDFFFFFFSSRRRHTRLQGDWSSDVCSSDLKVRIVDEHLGTAAKPRVLVESARGPERWSTMGCSENIIEASWQALRDGLELPLARGSSPAVGESL